jgi:hypothetical protein
METFLVLTSEFFNEKKWEGMAFKRTHLKKYKMRKKAQ